MQQSMNIQGVSDAEAEGIGSGRLAKGVLQDSSWGGENG